MFYILYICKKDPSRNWFTGYKSEEALVQAAAEAEFNGWYFELFYPDDVREEIIYDQDGYQQDLYYYIEHEGRRYYI